MGGIGLTKMSSDHRMTRRDSKPLMSLKALLGMIFGWPFVERFALCHRTVVVSVCLSCLSVTLMYCGQTVGWMKIKLGMQVGLGPGHIVFGDPSPPKKWMGEEHRTLQFFGPCIVGTHFERHFRAVMLMYYVHVIGCCCNVYFCRRSDRFPSTQNDRICSCHFAYGDKSSDPVIFPYNERNPFRFNNLNDRKR